MAPAPRLRLDEPAARRVMLARAIETADSEGKLLSQPEREQIDRDARKAAGASSTAPGGWMTPAQFLDARAQRILDAIEPRNADLAALQESKPWVAWVSAATPLLAFVLGVVTDVIANPHRVDLLSLPLLAIVAWNLVVYALLVASLFVRRKPGGKSFFADLGRWTDGDRALQRRPGNVRVHATAIFLRDWYAATRAMHYERVKRVLHLAAAAWAVGIILSLFVRGLVVEYRVGWESTFLQADQVNVLLNLLRLPALLLYSFAPFTPPEVANLHFSGGGGVTGGARWVFMYAALLVVVVIAPRALLAAWAWLRERRMGSAVPIDPGDPYYARVVSLLSTARVHLGLITHDAQDRATILQVLQQSDERTGVLASTEEGDVLTFVELPPNDSGVIMPAPIVERPSWRSRWLPMREAPTDADAAPAIDTVLHVMRSLADTSTAASVLLPLGRPVIAIARDAGVADALPMQAFAKNWSREHVLFDRIATALPMPQRGGFDRLRKVLDDRNQARFARAMGAIGEHLMFAASQSHEIRDSALNMQRLLSATERDALSQARQAAMDDILRRLRESTATLWERLAQIHGIEPAAITALQDEVEHRFQVDQPVHAPQAGMAGAATGAAMGASVDLLAGGLTLGAAAALGALIGGGAAYAAATWKNRPTGGGSTLVQLSDDMLQAILEAALLRYLAVIHHGRPSGPDVDTASREVAAIHAAVEEDQALLAPYWSASRSPHQAARMSVALGHQLEAITRKILLRL